MNEEQNSNPLQHWGHKCLDGALLLITLFLGGISFFVIQDIVLVIATSLVVKSADITVQEIYTISTIRNGWMFCGGCFFLGFLIIGIDYHARKLGKMRTTRLLVITLIFELLIIGIGSIIT